MICPKNISFLKHFFMKHTFLNGFSQIFENRSKIHLKVLLKERKKEKKERKERKKRKKERKERKKEKKKKERKKE